MEQPCYKCGQLVEEGRVFCPHCVAPQIRVVVAEPPAVAVPAAYPTQAAALPASETVPVLAVPMTWSQAMKPAALAALVASILTALGLNLLVGMLSVGILAVVFYRQGRAGIPIKTGTGIRLGALGGLLCYCATTLLLALAATVPDFRSRFHAQIVANAQKFAASYGDDPQMQAAMTQLKTPEGFLMAMILAAILWLALSILLGAAGGTLAAKILGRREKS